MVEAAAPEPLSLLWIFVALAGLSTGALLLEGLVQRGGLDAYPKLLYAAYRELALLGCAPTLPLIPHSNCPGRLRRSMPC